jgi:hypothetical protein
MSQEPPEFTNWKDAWEWHAGQAAQSYAEQSAEELLEMIRQRQYDPYYQIWYNLREVGTLAQCAPVLMDVLRRETGEAMMLVRYHCAAALFHLLGYRDEPIPKLRAKAQWDQNGEEARQQALDQVEIVIRKRLKKQNESPTGTDLTR